MRPNVDAERIRALARELSRIATGETTLYLTGGSTAVLQGWRASTLDIDLRIEPDSDELLRRISELKNELEINVELVSPSDFIPERPAGVIAARSSSRRGRVTVRRFDLYSQALSRIEPGWRTTSPTCSR